MKLKKKKQLFIRTSTLKETWILQDQDLRQVKMYLWRIYLYMQHDRSNFKQKISTRVYQKKIKS